ncbi:MAG: arsenate reductase (glutaredoxin) [Bacteriovoracaceae bacterium]|jgi:arsenate reductase (glutaredoxin)|nr:arsenate reductase (glutaredoxin) [Bacteriovoracaceae bacterium]
MPINIYYHNPRCSKSRQGLALLKENNVIFEIKEYLNEGFTSKELVNIFRLLDQKPIDVVRKKEAIYKEVITDPASMNQSDWVRAILENPSLIERPILVTNKGAKIGRPPEDLLKII